MQKECSILIGGQAGDGIKLAGALVANLLNRLGYWTFVYIDYPSLITGGHNFAIVRAGSEKILAHADKVNILVALNQETVEKHAWRLKEKTLIVFDSNSVKAKGLGLPLSEIVKNKGLPLIARNSAGLGAVASVLEIEFPIVADVIRSSIKKKTKENIEAAKVVYNQTKKLGKIFKLPLLKNPPKPLLTGNEAIALGAVKAGLKAYIAYPMTPSTGILHYLAKHKEKLNIVTIQLENEIGVIGAAQGASYAGVKTMVGTSGGGFALMTEHLSLAGQAEIPTVIVLAQRPAPASGVPTYTAQGDLFFALHAGHGDFPRIVIAPGDVEEAFYLTAEALNLAWKFQIPVIILSDKHLSESIFSAEFDENKIIRGNPKIWNKKGEYKRYAFTKNGISPLAFPGQKKAVVKSNSYEHDEFGITTENPKLVTKGSEKRLKKMKAIEDVLMKKETVKVYGNPKSKTALIAWGSTKGAVVEVAKSHNLKVIQPLFLHPFPVWELKKHLSNVKRIIGVEVNSTGQLCKLLKFNGFKVDEQILKYDGRPFTVDELEKKVKKIIL
ncbi:2-oxoacid:acceptor oxidoreductase subunit alpha [Patescibacteria group bacterium]|nr:2-oxoacid:acceptor oxidoreductase subunit alpha [Patescibacteria group bacterium]